MRPVRRLPQRIVCLIATARVIMSGRQPISRSVAAYSTEHGSNDFLDSIAPLFSFTRYHACCLLHGITGGKGGQGVCWQKPRIVVARASRLFVALVRTPRKHN